jgi:phosphoribosylaminoimidazole-succinocarboxamide synthase
MELVKQGKVRDVYADGDDLILVASDRVSVYDVILPTPIPDKGAILTQLSLWFFEQLSDIVDHHVLSQDVPMHWAGRALRCRRLDIIAVECIARGYLVGHGLTAYQQHGGISGHALPSGLVESDQLPRPIFTPSTKAELGEHDELITVDSLSAQVGPQLAAELERLTLALYARGADIARETGILVADTKFEFGHDSAGNIVLADEVFTPDSSRFWSAADYRPGGPQHSWDKQFVRDWSATQRGWDRTAPGPVIPADIVAETRQRYVEIYERLTGKKWSS